MPSPLPLLFLGNSYTMNHALDQLVATMLAEGSGQSWEASRLTSGGLTLETHLARVEGEHDDWVTALASKDAQWSWVFLQEQSQIPGFPEHNSYVQGSLSAASGLTDYATARDAQAVFLMTWGRRDGDSQNSERYPDFTTMQDRLAEGYLRYVETNSTPERPVWIAPAGLAWQHIHDALLADGQDPLDDGSLFTTLYASDGSHPSVAGNHLNAAVIYATLTGLSPVGLTDPSGQLDAETTAALQEAAAAVVLGDSPDILYPWEDEDPGDTEDDTEDDADTADPGDTEDESSPEDDSDGESAPPESTGCRSSRAAVLPLLPLLLLGMRRR